MKIDEKIEKNRILFYCLFIPSKVSNEKPGTEISGKFPRRPIGRWVGLNSVGNYESLRSEAYDLT